MAEPAKQQQVQIKADEKELTLRGPIRPLAGRIRAGPRAKRGVRALGQEWISPEQRAL
jgi:hypothetical protein